MQSNKRNRHTSTITSLVLIITSLANICAHAQAPQPGNFDIQGFKNIKLGLSSEEVSNLGYTCKNSGYTLADEDPVECVGPNTLFGMQASVYVSFTKDKADYIGVTARSATPIDLVGEFSRALGKPRTYITPSIGGHPIRVYYWLSKSGNSISISKSVHAPENEGKSVNGSLTYSQGAAFNGQRSTYRLLKREATSQNRNSDF